MAETNATTLTKQAAAWLVALDAGSADLIEFEQWRCADTRHAVAFAEVAASWEFLDVAKAARTSIPRSTPPLLGRRAMLRGAAVAAVVVVGISLTSLYPDQLLAETGIGERRSIVVDEHHRIELNTNSRVRWRVEGGRAFVWLDRGEVALAVAPGGRLMLKARNTTHELGAGTYNARQTADGLDLLVLAGSGIAVGEARAMPGDSLSLYSAVASIHRAKEIELDRAAAWRRGEIAFAGEPLSFAVAEYNRYLAKPIVIADSTIQNLRLGGRFTLSGSSDFLIALETSLGIRATSQPDGTIALSRPTL